jgi:hypothetical protein
LNPQASLIGAKHLEPGIAAGAMRVYHGMREPGLGGSGVVIAG